MTQVSCRVVAHVLAQQEDVDFSEAGTLLVITVPAFRHQVIDLAGTTSWLGQDYLSPIIVEIVT